MPCTHCPHCRALAELDDLRLATPPAQGSRADHEAFYLRYGRVYDMARARSPQPQQLIRRANPDLTASQCKSYLKRARALGAVSSPARGDEPTPAPRDEARTPPARPVAGTSGGAGPDADEQLAADRALLDTPAPADITDDEITARSLAAVRVLNARPSPG